MKPREYYEARAKSLIKELREDKHLTYEELAKLLGMTGKRANQILINRINRGRFSFAFALHLLAVLEVKTLQIPPLPKPPAKPGK